MKKACAYIRVSKERVDMVSPEQQRGKVSLQAELMGADLLHVYEDIDISGRHDRRPDFQKMIASIKENKYDVCLVYKIDRFARNVQDFHRYVTLMEKHGCALVSVSQNFDTSTPMGRFMRNILADFAQLEREMLSETVKDNMLANAARGRWNGGRPPHGYMADGKILTVNPDEAPAVIKAFGMAAQGLGADIIAQELTDTHKPRYGSAKWGRYFWHPGTVLQLLKNPAYTGKQYYGGKIYDSNHPALISDEQFEKVQKGIVSRRNMPPGAKGSTHLLSGLLYCTHCKHGNWRIKYPGSGSENLRYRCYTKDAKGNAACPTNMLDKRTLEARVVNEILVIASNPALVKRFFTRWERDVAQNNKPQQARIKELRRQEKVIKGKIDRLLSEYLDHHTITRQQFSEKNAEYLQEQEVLNAEIEKLGQVDAEIERARNDLSVISASLKSFRESWEYLTPEETKIAVGFLIDRIDVYRDYVDIIFFRFHKIRIKAKDRTKASIIF